MVTHKHVLKNVPLFAELNDEELGFLTASGSRRKLPAKNVVFQEGEPGDVLLIILSGKVKVLLSGSEGQEFILTMLGPGNFFGEMAILESTTRSASVMTVEPCEFFLLSQKDFSALLKKHPAIALKILKNLSQRLRKTNEQIRSLVMFDIYGRVGRCLLNLAEDPGGTSQRPVFRIQPADIPGISQNGGMFARSRQSSHKNPQR